MEITSKTLLNLKAREALRRIEFSVPHNKQIAFGEVQFLVCPSCMNDADDGHDKACDILKLWEYILY